MGIKEILKEREFLILDGAMGTMLQAKGLKLGEIPEVLSIEAKEEIVDIHKGYIAAGANVIYTNTFGANRYKLSGCKYSVDEIIKAAIANARQAAIATDTLVALDIGPIGQLLEPSGTLSFEDAYDIYKEQVIAGRDADLIVFETMTDLYELKAAVLAAKENSKLPIFCTMTFEENMRTFTGVNIPSMILTLEGLGVDALGINCSLGPKEMLPVVNQITTLCSIPVIVKPNAGLPNPVTDEYDISAEEFADYLSQMVPFGVKIFGGCCGTTPEYIKGIVNSLKDKHCIENEKKHLCAVCTATRTVEINQPRIIGERINPTGKKLFKQALLENDINYILNQAIEQINAGADILDVNVGLPSINEKEMMVKVVKAIQGIVDTPLQIDSTIPEVVEAALRIYNGKAILNSVNGEDNILETLLPIVKKYGAAVVGLTLDNNGIPKTAEGRFDIAQKIVNRAIEYGINRQDIFIDCLTLTASAEQDGVMETLRAVKMVKERLGVKTVLGVSNISFGLPNRELVNQNFLTMALTYGLDLPIINPNIYSMTGAVRAFKLLTSIDKNSAEFIEHYNKDANTLAKPAVENKDIDIFYAIKQGLKQEGSDIVRKLLETHDSMEIINTMLIPALDIVGDEFEKGKIFLPQLISSAAVAQGAFDIIKQKLIMNNCTPVSKGSIVIATVKGDIHDIGKNIVKVILENYGYKMIDLGRDVEYQAVIDAIKESGCKLVGLSALMTTTLKSMEETIKLIKANNLDCKIMVGGAVLTPEYAKSIGADFYSKDAKEAVDIAKKVFS